MKAGELLDRIELYTLDPNTAWGDHVARVWAKVEVPTGNEGFETEENPLQQAGTVTIRDRIGVRRGMRIRFGVRVFEIQSVAQDRKGAMTLAVGELAEA